MPKEAFFATLLETACEFCVDSVDSNFSRTKEKKPHRGPGLVFARTVNPIRYLSDFYNSIYKNFDFAFSFSEN